MKELIRRVTAILHDKKIMKKWRKVCAVLACLVVFVSTYALILPAITMEKYLDCGIPEHQHTAACYERRLVCGLEEGEPENTDEVALDVIEEDDPSDMDLVETDVIEDDVAANGHVHTDACYEYVLVCGMEPHTHSAACYKKRPVFGAGDSVQETVTATGDIVQEDGQITEDEIIEGSFEEGDSVGETASYTGQVDAPDSEEIMEEDDYAGEPAANGSLDEGTLSSEGEQSDALTETVDQLSDQQGAQQGGTTVSASDGSEETSGDTPEGDATADDETRTREFFVLEDSDDDQPSVNHSSEEPSEENPSEDGQLSGADGENHDTADGSEAAGENGTADLSKTDDNKTAKEDTAEDGKETGETSAKMVADSGNEKNLHNETEDPNAIQEAGSADKDGNTIQENDTEAGMAGQDEAAAAQLSLGTYLTEDNTLVYYNRKENDSESGWLPVDNETVLTEADTVRVCLSYNIPAGTLADSNVARYALPAQLQLSDRRMKEINRFENGLAVGAQDEAEKAALLGAEAIEGNFRPDDKKASESEELISAIVNVENKTDQGGEVYSQELVFKFVPYTVEKNSDQVGKEGTLISRGEAVSGYFALDFALDEITFNEKVSAPSDSTDTSGQGAEAVMESRLVFAGKDEASGRKEISATLRMILNGTDNPAAKEELGKAGSDLQAENGEEGEDSGKAADNTDKAEESEDSNKEKTDADQTADSEEGKSQDDSEKADEGQTEAAAAAIATPTDFDAAASSEAAQDGKEESSADLAAKAVDMPAQTFDESLTVETTGLSAQEGDGGILGFFKKLFGIGNKSGDGNSANGEEESILPSKSVLNVHVEAEEGTFPAGTVMSVKAVRGEDLETVSDAISNTIDAETCGFQAVDITFYSPEGEEIEPAKPVRVTFTSEAISAASQAEKNVAPVIFHLDNDGSASTISSLDASDASTAGAANEDESSNGSTVTGLLGDPDKASDAADHGTTGGTDSNNNNISIETDEFSIYAIVYTVHFEYEVDGETYTSASMPGAEYISLADMIRGLGIVSEEEVNTFVSRIATVASTDEDVAVVEPVEGILHVRVLRDGDAQIVITMRDGAAFRVDVVADGETTAANDIATVSTVGDLYLPAEAGLAARALDAAQCESAIAAVQAAEGNAFSDAAAETVYKVFDISLENVEAEQYDGFQVEVKLSENVAGRDFRLFHIHDGETTEIELNTVSRPADRTGIEIVSGFTFETKDFSEFVLRYTADFTYGEQEYNLQGGERILHSNLAAFVTDATIDIDGTIYGQGDPWVVRDGVTYALTLKFKENGPKQFPHGGEEMMMDPADLGGLRLVPGQSGTFDIPMGLYGTVTGNRWWTDGDGQLHIQFGEDPDGLLARSNKTYINCCFDVQFSGSEGIIKFNDDVQRPWIINEETDVSVNKSGYYDAATGKMKYTITVTSTGKSKNVKVTDTFANSTLLTLDTDSIAISPEKELDAGQNAASATGFTRVIREMDHNETVTITYTADVDESELGPGGKVVAEEDGKNTVRAESGPHKDEKTHIVNEIRFSDLGKVSTSSEDAGDKVKLNWKITANTNRIASLVGSKITDKISWDSRDIMEYAVDANGKVKLHVVGTAADGRTWSKDIFITPSSTSPQSWIWTVENIGEDQGTPLSYEITYQTVADKQTASSVSVKNDAENESGGGDTGTGIIPGPEPVVTKKEATAVEEDYIEWTIVVNVPDNGFDDHLEVIDTLPSRYIYTTGLTYKDIIEAPIDNNVSVSDPNGQAYYDLAYEESATADKLTITFFKDQSKVSPGIGGPARTITIKIRTKNNSEWIDLAAGDPDLAYLQTHINNAKVNGTEISAGATPVKKTIKKNFLGTDKTAAGLPRFKYEVILSGVKKAEDISFTDTFNSEYLELENGSYEIRATDRTDMYWNGSQSYAQCEETDNGTVRFSAGSIPLKENGSPYAYYRITYYLAVKDQAALQRLQSQAFMNGGKYTLKNTAVWEGPPSEVEVEYEHNPLTKEGYFVSENDEERLYRFVIDVNPNRYQLSGDGSETIELTDEHTSNLTVNYASVQAYEIPEGVDIGDAKTACISGLLPESYKCSVPWNFSGNDGIFYLSDKTHYVLVYDAVVIGSGPQSFTNVAELETFTATHHNSKEYSAEIEGGGEIWEIQLLKYKDGMTSNGLEGATFQLFRGTGEYVQVSDDQGNTWWEEKKEPMKYGDTEETRRSGLVGKNITFTTGSDGTAKIQLEQEVEGNEIEGNVHYFLKEIDSPPGYQIDSSVEYWAFTLTQDPDEVNYGDTNRRDEYGNRQWIYFYYNDILKMANTETTEPLDVKVNKSWFDKNGDPISKETLDDSFVATVQLMRKTDNGDYMPVKVEYGPDGKPSSITEYASSTDDSQTKLTIANDWSWSWSQLPRVKMGGRQGFEIIHRYAYKVEEVELDGYIVAVEETENSTTKTYALKNYKKPDEKDTEITVNKEWQDTDGNEIDGTTKKLPPDIRFYLYQVVSTTPFTATPRSGGAKYVIAEDSRLVNPAASPASSDYGLYKVTEKGDWTTTFESLPEIRIAGGRTFYYGYYVRELPLEGYSTAYTYDGTTRTIVNRELPSPDNNYIDIGLEKKWISGNNATPPAGASATFTVHQLKSEKSEAASAGSVSIIVDEATVLSCNPGDTIVVKVGGNYSDGYNMVITDTQERWLGWKKVEECEYTIPDTFTGSQVSVQIADDSPNVHVDSVELKGAKPTKYSEFTDTGVTRTITLPIGLSWSTTIRNLIEEDAAGNRYRYYITEDSSTPAASNVSFKDDLGHDIAHAIYIPGQTVEVTNTYEQTGDLEVSKTVVSDADADKDAEFTFKVKLGDTRISGTYGDMDFDNGVATFTLRHGGKKTATGLPADMTYTVTETDAPGFILTGKTGDSGSISTTKSTAAFTNTRLGELMITKIIQTNGATDSAKTGTFYFAVYKEADVENGRPKTDAAAAATGQIVVAEGGRNTVTVQNLPYGTYCVYELTGENGTPIVSENSGILALINGIPYTVTGSGTMVTVGTAQPAGTEGGGETETPARNRATLINEVTDFEFTKNWKDASLNNADWQDGQAITVTVSGKIEQNGTVKTNQIGTYTIRKENGICRISTETEGAPTLEKTGTEEKKYTFKIRNLPKTGTIESVTGEYTYSVTEAVLAGYNTSYTSPSSTTGTPIPTEGYAGNGGTIINTPVGGYELPRTGGIGTTIFTALGGLMTVTAGAILIIKRLRRRKVRHA